MSFFPSEGLEEDLKLGGCFEGSDFFEHLSREVHSSALFFSCNIFFKTVPYAGMALPRRYKYTLAFMFQNIFCSEQELQNHFVGLRAAFAVVDAQ